jgi:hypothetical protein
MALDQEAIEYERLDSDIEQAELEACGRTYWRSVKRMRELRNAGRLSDAALACPHGGGYPLASLAARNANDPRAGESGERCCDCGSVIERDPETWRVMRIIHPCEE